jgi:biotin operon repressor
MRFPVQAKCNYVSGDLLAENLEAEVQRTIATASKHLRTTQIVIVE